MEALIWIVASVAFMGFIFMLIVLFVCMIFDDRAAKRRRCDHDYKYIAERKMWVCSKCGKETKL